MEMALSTNSFAMVTSDTSEGGMDELAGMDEADDSDSEMEYMIPLHSE